MTARIERHRVSGKALEEATEDFYDEVSIRVRGEQNSGRDGFGWQMISRDLLDYAGARSVDVPETDADICAAVYSAAEARIGALKLDGAPTSAEFSVHLTYTGTGVFYRDHDEVSEESREQRGVSLSDWAQTLYLCVVADLHADNKGALIGFAADFDESRVLHRALAYYCFPEVGAEREQLVRYVESALGPFFDSLGKDSGERHPDLGSVSPDLLFLHALLARNEEVFWTLMSERLAWFRDNSGDGTPRTLLPVPELAFAALAVRVEGWKMPFESAYLPRRLVEGRLHGSARVGAYGADKDAEALRALADGPLVVERPTGTFAADRDIEQTYRYEDEDLEELARAESAVRRSASLLQSRAWSALLGFRVNSVADPDADHPRQLAALTHASQYTAAVFAGVGVEPGETVDVTFGASTVSLSRVEPSSKVSEGARRTAIEYALLSGSRERLDTLVAYPHDAFLRKDEGRGFAVFPLYDTAFLTYLKAERARGWRRRAEGETRPTYGAVRAAVDDAVAALAHYSMPGYPAPPVVLLSQLVAGDREGFELALADTLERYRDAHSIGDRAGDSDSLIDPHSLALACLARAQGWQVRVESGYLPRGVLDRAAAMFG
ncbi:immunity 49 family protein [Nocardiopsis ganjiahuensis]|uniref:immunity 49 family protein n=1 Tax=Nocardiopsis ganjiahuensis TaxID=239984 RepID=UPI00034D9503|nr:immunity 49 family protein [Nocardiopsis ganjiahuensis]